jgi:DNA-binding HxlR family transcriptional regulator
MSKRSYKQNCALARANDVIGERWTLLLVRDLLISPHRFNQLLASQKGMGTNLLASRLKDLETANIVERRAGEGGARLYVLTERGRALEPAVLALIRWGLTHGPENRPGDHHHDEWDLLALKAEVHVSTGPGQGSHGLCSV